MSHAAESFRRSGASASNTGSPGCAAAGSTPAPDLPIWRPPTGETAGVALVSSARAVAAGLRFRPIEDTVRDTLEWQRSRPPDVRDRLAAGLSPEQEAELLRRWRESRREGGAGT